MGLCRHVFCFCWRPPTARDALEKLHCVRGRFRRHIHFTRIPLIGEGWAILAAWPRQKCLRTLPCFDASLLYQQVVATFQILRWSQDEITLRPCTFTIFWSPYMYNLDVRVIRCRQTRPKRWKGKMCSNACLSEERR